MSLPCGTCCMWWSPNWVWCQSKIKVFNSRVVFKKKFPPHNTLFLRLISPNKKCFVWELYSFAQVITEFWMGGVPSYAELRGRISHLSFVLPEVVGTYTGSDLRKHDTDGDKHEWQILEGFFLPRNLLNSGSLSKQCNLIPYVSLVCLITDTLSTQLVFIYTV